MTQLSEIAVKVVNINEPDAPSSQVKALLQELQSMLYNLVHTGESASVDIRSLPITPGDYDYLKSLLGEGEVSAAINALGTTKIVETEIPGVWWVTYYNAETAILTEIIEVTELPDILKTQHQDLQQAITLFQSKIGEFKKES